MMSLNVNVNLNEKDFVVSCVHIHYIIVILKPTGPFIGNLISEKQVYFM